MKKKLITVLIGFVAIMLMPIAASASSYGFKQGDYVELNGYRFIVLDPETDYLFADFYLENRVFDLNNTQIYDPNDTNNVAYYLNSIFFDNLGGISDYVKHHNFTIGNERNESEKIVNTKIGMISYSEWNKYYNLNVINNPYSYFWTRTPSRGNPASVWYIDTAGNRVSSNAVLFRSVRPVLHLASGLMKYGIGSSSDPYVMSTEPIIVLSEIKDLSLLKTSTTEITLTWKNPTESNFSHLNLYKNGTLIKGNFSMETYNFEGLNPSQEYKFTIKAVDIDGEETEGISIVVSTNDIPLVPEIQNLTATTKHDRINLSWNNPKSDFFNHVKIYRKVDNEETTKSSFKSLIQPMTVHADTSGVFDPMFETNGTYWNDLTVKPATSYSYKLTTVNIADAESEGTIVQATTLGEPPPELEGGGFEETENGDFLFTWTSPTTGQVKVLIDGKEYKTVDASLKQILIPKEDMKYDIFNNPKVTLVPITEDGKEGTPTKPGEGGGSGGIGGGKLPFGPVDLLTSSMGLLGLIAPILLLSMAIIFFRPIKNVIVKAVQTHRERKMQR